MSIDRFNILCRHKLTRMYFFFFQRFKISVYRRYSDFDVFHELLLQRYAYRMVPSLPPKRVLKGGMMLCRLLYVIKSQKLVMKPVNQSVIQCNHGCCLWFGALTHRVVLLPAHNQQMAILHFVFGYGLVIFGVIYSDLP